jgi:hypothetical protein
MTHEQAHQILDRHKDGQHYTEFTIKQALRFTGDLSGDIDGHDQDCEKKGLERMDMARSVAFE